jgi:FtsP/CotA-like multicopper oxidase with cupredoxin domain
VFDLRIGAVAKRLGDTTVRMLGYNGSIPGPALKVQQGSEVIVHVTNDGDLEATVHWHGLRLDNQYDGVPHETQTLIPVGGDFTYRIRFPDPGLYWYHPHVREDYTQEMGLYGNILVVSADPDYWPPANAAIDWQFTAGDRVKIALVNEMDSDHPMHHPFHLHGAGRFLVLARDGVPEPNLVWKDTVLVRTGQTVDILFDVTNQGLWMAHCHIAEHMQSGMMFSFTVARQGAAR